jgi:FKBP-type peptidyl-prolyl cis-trans isomerase
MKWLLVGSVAMGLLVAGCGGDTASQSSAGGGSATGTAPAETASTESTTPAGEGAPSAPAKVDEKDYKTTASGLKYAILKPGSGEEAGHQEVSVHYTGWLQSTGQKFDSSLDRGEPITFPLGHGQVIKGWDEGVKGMKVGEKRQLVIPAALGYGEMGTPDGSIPPNSTLVFDVELVSVGETHAH